MGFGDVFLTAEWRNLAMLNYEVDPQLLAKFVPKGTELDKWNERVFVSLVGFRFLKTKVFGIPIPFHRDFDEVNLRLYVRRREVNEVRRGVVFIKEIVPRWAITTTARTFYNENYVTLPMSHQIQKQNGTDFTVQYGWRHGKGWNKMKLSVTGSPALPENDSAEQFITEHYWGYASQRNGQCAEYRVNHSSWKVWNGRGASFDGDVEELYGKDLAAALSVAPSSAFLAEGSEVTVFRGREL
ncbi:MAG TPA: DUF2071 domain-containing protein [Candidatus Dormibacteraeota bacterium]|nr:DUF2071 domain-containing protein [Candidatus Dormibacteraeota bacterium]